MKKDKMNQLTSLLTELYNERIEELTQRYPEEDFSKMGAEIYDFDDSDRLIEGIDILYNYIVETKGEE